MTDAERARSTVDAQVVLMPETKQTPSSETILPLEEKVGTTDPSTLPRANPYTLRRAESPVETRYFTDTENPGVAFPLRLRGARGMAALFAINELAVSLIDTYVLGAIVTGKMLPNGEPLREDPEPVINWKGETTPVNETLCRVVAGILSQQEPSGDGYKAWTDKELFLLARDAESVFGDMTSFSNQIRNSGGTISSKNG